MRKAPGTRLPGPFTPAAALALLLCLPAAANAASVAAPAGPGSDDAAYDPFLGFDPVTGEPQKAGGEGDAEPYRDRVIASDRLETLPDDDQDERLATGAPRAAHVELISSQTRFAGSEDLEYGVGFGGFFETDDLGALSLEGLLFRTDRAGGDASWGGRATLWQRGLAMPGGWTVNSGLGVVNTSLPRLLQDQQRFFLPSVPLLGLATEWTRDAGGVAWNVAVGRGGVFNGGLINGFETGDGAVASAGAQWNWSQDWSGALSLLATDDRVVPTSQGLPDFQAGANQALVFGNRWQGDRDAVNLMLQASDGDAGSAAGAWFDARSIRGRWTHRYGAFHLQPDLAWGAWPINNDVRGGYYRLDFNRARWSWNASIDRIDSITGSGFEGWYGSGFLRWQANPRLAYGGSLSARSASSGSRDSAQAVQAFADSQMRWGQLRAQLDYARSDPGTSSWEITFDQALPLRQGSRLSVAAGYGETDDGTGTASPTLTLASYGGFSLSNSVTLDGSARWRRLSGDETSSGLDLSLGLRWQITPRWSLAANVSENRGPRTSPFVLDPLANPVPPDDLPRDRSVYASLRYDFSAGRARPVLGGPANAATGDIVGSVFLDENGDGQRSATEQGARNLTVTLDDRFVARTDDQGRFRFERVAVGAHVLEVIQDNLPLPWSLAVDAARRTVRVEVRGTATVDLGATRPR
jgi:hypothetical protein